MIIIIILARFLQDSSYLARKASFLVQDLQDLVQGLASFARKILARFGYFLQDGFYWVCVCAMKVPGREVSQSLNNTEHCVSEAHGHSPCLVTDTHTYMHTRKHTHTHTHTHTQMYRQ